MRCSQPSSATSTRQPYVTNQKSAGHCQHVAEFAGSKQPLTQGGACLVVDGGQRGFCGRVGLGRLALGGCLAHRALLRRLVVVRPVHCLLKRVQSMLSPTIHEQPEASAGQECKHVRRVCRVLTRGNLAAPCMAELQNQRQGELASGESMLCMPQAGSFRIVLRYRSAGSCTRKASISGPAACIMAATSGRVPMSSCGGIVSSNAIFSRTCRNGTCEDLAASPRAKRC